MNTYEQGFKAHRNTHGKQYRKIGHFEGRHLAIIGGRKYDVADLAGMGFTNLQILLLE